MRPSIDDHDYETKMKAAHRFLDDGNKVKFVIRFRGREIVHQHIAFGILEKVKTETAEVAKIELSPSMDGRQMIMILSPK